MLGTWEFRFMIQDSYTRVKVHHRGIASPKRRNARLLRNIAYINSNCKRHHAMSQGMQSLMNGVWARRVSL